MTLTGRVLSEKRRFIYPLIVAIVLNLAVFAAVLYPLSLKVGRGEESAQAAAAQLAAARREHDAARATVKGKVSADAELEKFYHAVLPADMSEARRITFSKIEELMKEAHVTLKRRVFEPSQEQDSTLGKLSMNISLVGQYRDVRRFIYDLETAPEFLILENVVLAQGAENEPRLNVDVKVSTYYRAGADGH
jgi:Tfp pilus assembly protein PilO